MFFCFFIRFSSHKNLSFFYSDSRSEGCPSHKLCMVWFSVFVPTPYRACYSSKRLCGRSFIFLFSKENSRHFSACLLCHFSFQTAIRSTRLHTSHNVRIVRSLIIKKEKISAMLSTSMIGKEMCKRVSPDVSSFKVCCEACIVPCKMCFST